MGTTNHYQLMAEYNRWMNGKLYTVCADIPDEKRKADLGAFFRSIHSTLNHLLWGDRIWLRRFDVHAYAMTPIGQDLYADFAELRTERVQTDALIAQWVEGFRDDWLAQRFEFTSASDGKTRRAPTWVFISQFFNHQTHHRGQVTTLIKQLGYEPGITDIPWMPGAVEIV
jgi:uncharacterized damage-inducible protein DinB